MQNCVFDLKQYNSWWGIEERLCSNKTATKHWNMMFVTLRWLLNLFLQVGDSLVFAIASTTFMTTMNKAVQVKGGWLMHCKFLSKSTFLKFHHKTLIQGGFTLLITCSVFPSYTQEYQALFFCMWICMLHSQLNFPTFPLEAVPQRVPVSSQGIRSCPNTAWESCS